MIQCLSVKCSFGGTKGQKPYCCDVAILSSEPQVHCYGLLSSQKNKMFSQTQTSMVDQHDCGELSVIPALTCSNYSCVEASFSYEMLFLWTFWAIKWDLLAFTLILNTSFLSPYLHRFRKFSELKTGEVMIAVHSGFNNFIWNLVNPFQIMHVKCHASKVKRICTRLT